MLPAILKALLTCPCLASVLTGRSAPFKFESSQQRNGSSYQAQIDCSSWGKLKLENHPQRCLQTALALKSFQNFGEVIPLKVEARWDSTGSASGVASLHGAQGWQWKAQHGLNHMGWALSLSWSSVEENDNLSGLNLPPLAYSNQKEALQREWNNLYAELQSKLESVPEDEHLACEATYFPCLNFLNEVYFEFEALENQEAVEKKRDACTQHWMDKLKALSENEAIAIRMGFIYQSILAPLLISDLIFKYFDVDLKTQPLEVFEKHFAFIHQGWKAHFAAGSLARAKTDEALRLLQAHLGPELLRLNYQNLRLTEAPEQEIFALHCNEAIQKSLLWLLTLAYRPPSASDAGEMESMLAQSTPEDVDQVLDKALIHSLAVLYRGLFRTFMMTGKAREGEKDANLLIKPIFQTCYAQEARFETMIHLAIECSPHGDNPKGDYKDQQQARFIGNAIAFLKKHCNKFPLELQKRFEGALKSFAKFSEESHSRRFSELDLALLNHSTLIAEQLELEVKLGKEKLFWKDKRWALTKTMHRLWAWLKAWFCEVPSKKLTLTKDDCVSQALEEKTLAEKKGAPLKSALKEKIKGSEVRELTSSQAAKMRQPLAFWEKKNQNRQSPCASTETGEELKQASPLLALSRHDGALANNDVEAIRSKPHIVQPIWSEVLQESASSFSLQFSTQESINFKGYDESQITFVNP